ncbi:MAG: hypothetical protein ACYTDX_04200 [Planctomycetota bacterium]|jgi:hypothetical protein
MTAMSALAHGWGTARRTWRWLLVAVFVNLLLAVPAALWIGSRIDAAVSGRADADRFAGGMDADALGDLQRALSGGDAGLAFILGGLVVLAALVRALFDAGLAGVAAREPHSFSLSAIARRAARMGRRFIILLLPAAAAVLVARMLLDGALAKWWQEVVDERATTDLMAWTGTRARELLTVGVLFSLGRVSDAARGLIALDPTRSAWAAWIRGFRFFLKNPIACSVVGGVPALLQGAAIVGIGVLVIRIEGAEVVAVLLALLAFQGLMLLREALHAVSLTGMVGLVRGRTSTPAEMTSESAEIEADGETPPPEEDEPSPDEIVEE